MQIQHRFIVILLLITIASCKSEKTPQTSAESEGSQNKQESISLAPDSSMTSTDIVEAALQAWKSNDRERFDEYLDSLSDPTKEIWSSLTEKCSGLDVQNLSFEEFDTPPNDPSEDSPNIVYVQVSNNSGIVGGFIMHRWPNKHWEISRGGINCNQ